MANCFVRGNKLWVDYYVEGNRIRKATGLEDTKANRSFVKKDIIPKLSAMIITGEIHQKQPKTFGYYFDIFLTLKDSNRSYFVKKPIWNKVNEKFKNLDVDKITRLDVKSYINSLPIKSVSKGAYKTVLKEVLELAVDDGVLKTNPAINIKLHGDVQENIQYFTKEEVKLILSRAEGILKPYLMLAFHTGMRPEEILGLQSNDVSDGWIEIKRVRTRGRIDIPKTRNSVRKVPCPSFVINELEQIKSDHLFLFRDIDDATKLRRIWPSLLKKCELPKRKLYSARHTFATIMLQDGIVSINELAGLLGHSSPKITLAHYASVIDSKQIDLGRDFNLFG
ncbi:site-specific integrase [Sulfuricurvum sp.]|uniref:site-specific integrase n=1 Tax=Sulfuricurvum sp. TaxID=2025608 RepID=UPI0035642F61